MANRANVTGLQKRSIINDTVTTQDTTFSSTEIVRRLGEIGGGSTAPGVLSSRYIPLSELGISREVERYTLTKDDPFTDFPKTGVLYGQANGYVDSTHPQAIYQISHADWSGTNFPIPTNLSDIWVKTSFWNFADGNMWMEFEPVIDTIEPFTTVEGLQTHRIKGYVEVTGQDGWNGNFNVNFTLCVGYRPSLFDPDIGFALLPFQGQFNSAMLVELVSSQQPLGLAAITLGASGTVSNEFAIAETHTINFNTPLQATDRIMATVNMPVTVIGDMDLSGAPTTTVLPFRIDTIMSQIGHRATCTAIVDAPAWMPQRFLYLQAAVSLDTNRLIISLPDKGDILYGYINRATSVMSDMSVGNILVVRRVAD